MRNLLTFILLVLSITVAFAGGPVSFPSGITMLTDGSNATADVAFNGVAPLTAIEKTQALVGSASVDFTAKDITAADIAINHGTYTSLRVDEVFELANGASATSGTDFLVGLDSELGILKMYDREGVAGSAEFYFTNNTAAKAWGDAKFTVTEDNASTVNVFISAAAGRPIVIQNNSGSVVTLGMMWVGGR